MKKILILAMLAGLIFLASGVTYAQEDDIKNETLSGIESESASYMTGKIDLKDSEGVVIDDTRYLFSSGTQCFTESGILMNLTSFSEGTKVKFVLDNDGKTIVKLIKVNSK